MSKHICVMQPYLPLLEKFISYLETIWENKILTNGDYFHFIKEKKAAGLSVAGAFSA